MRKILPILWLLIFAGPLSNAEDTIVVGHNTRTYTLTEALSLDSLGTSELLKPFEGLNRNEIKKAYQVSLSKVDSIIQADSLSGSFFSKNWMRTKQIVKDASLDSKMTVTYLTPLFLMVLFLVFVPYMILTFVVPPFLKKAEKPEYDEAEECGVDGKLIDEEDAAHENGDEPEKPDEE